MSPLEILERSFRPFTIPTRAPQICDRCNPHRSGVYLLVANGSILYVGSSIDVETRVWSHSTKRLAGQRKPFDRALWLPLPAAVMEHYEGAFIRALSPEYNRSAPRYCGYDNEILEGFGLEPHADEHANAEKWRCAPTERGTSAIGSRIRELRVARTLSQAQLGAAIGISGAAVAQWETGVCDPTMPRLVKCAQALGVDLAAIFTPAPGGVQ